MKEERRGQRWVKIPQFSLQPPSISAHETRAQTSILHPSSFLLPQASLSKVMPVTLLSAYGIRIASTGWHVDS